MKLVLAIVRPEKAQPVENALIWNQQSYRYQLGRGQQCA
jgi:nitrogen regulatory protein PII